MNNICILSDAGDAYLDTGGIVGAKCFDGSAKSKEIFEYGLYASNNTVYVPNGVAKVQCAGTTIDFPKFQQLGYDPLSRVSGDMPSAETVIGWAKDLLNTPSI